MSLLSVEKIPHILVTVLQFICAWSFAFLFIWSILKQSDKGVNYLNRLHQIPCSGCAFFTNDYRLKCTVHPFEALSEDAIGCRDFEPGKSYNLTIENNLHSCQGCSKLSVPKYEKQTS